MDATRRRFGSLLEWCCAGVCTVGGVLLASSAIENFRSVPAVVPVIAEEAPDPPAIDGMPSGVARVPLLLLADRREIHLGDRLEDVAARLGPTAQLESESPGEESSGRRLTRFYSDAGVRFILVFDARGGDQHPRVSGIFIR
jgi:hypothetical protein